MAHLSRTTLRPAIVLLATLAVALTGTAEIATAAGTWNADSPLSSPLREATGPSVAVTTTGAAVAGWQAQQGDFGHVDAFLHTRAPGTGPFAMGGTRLMVDSPNAHTEGDMGIVTAVNPSGKAVVAWVRAAFNANFRVQAVVRPAGSSTWGPVQTLTAEGEDAGAPALAMNASGATVLVWRRHETATGKWHVQGAALTDAGVNFTALNGGGNIFSEPNDGFPDLLAPPVRVAIAPSGASVVAWDSKDASSTYIARWARRGPNDSAFGTMHPLGAITRFPDVAASDDGSFALTWVTGTGGTGSTASLARATTSDFGTATPVGSTPSAFTDSRVGLDAAGNAIVALVGTAVADINAKTRVGFTRCAAASTCAPFAWLSADSQSAESLDLAVNAAGDAAAVWKRSNGTRPLIEASLLARGANWDSPVFISGSTQSAYMPTVGIDGGGNVTAAWMSFAIRQTTGAVEGAGAPPEGPGPGGPGNGGGGNNGGDGGGGNTPTATDRTVSATVKQAAKVTATAAGSFAGPKVTCSEPAGGSCKATVSFTTPGPKPKKGKPKKIAAGSVKLTVAAGKSATPTVKLTKAAKTLLRSKHKLALTGTVVVTDAAGNKRPFAVKTTVKAPPAKKKKR
jgi:hypothetical protein